MVARSFFWVSAGVLGALAAACGSSGDGSSFSDGDGGDEGTLQSDGGLTAFSGDGSVVDPDAFAACAADTQQAGQLPLDIYMMIDTSGSMYELVSATASKWTQVKSALTSFVQDPGSAGIGVGLQFFPLPKAGVAASCTQSSQCGTGGPCLLKYCIARGLNNVIACDSDANCPRGATCAAAGVCSNEQNVYCPAAAAGQDCGTDANGFPMGKCTAITTSYCANGDSCTVGDYAAPAAAIAPLPGSAGALVAALGAKTPDGDTPTSAALTGAVGEAKTFAAANAGHTVVVVLATDGLPNECDADPNHIAAIASGAAAGAPSVKTFVLGVFPPSQAPTAQPILDQIASAGGTGKAFLIQTSQNVAQQFLAALNTIRGTALPCEYTLPVPKSGTPDYNKVNVEYTAAGGQTNVLPYVKSAANCGNAGGWYYDVDPATGGKPTKIIVCDNTCTSLKSAGQGSKITVVQGCQTVTGPLR